VLGAERGLALIESYPDAAGLIIQRTRAGVTALQSSRFHDLTAGHPPTAEPGKK
jgi:hypothetical protein